MRQQVVTATIVMINTHAEYYNKNKGARTGTGGTKRIQLQWWGTAATLHDDPGTGFYAMAATVNGASLRQPGREWK